MMPPPMRMLLPESLVFKLDEDLVTRVETLRSPPCTRHRSARSAPAPPQATHRHRWCWAPTPDTMLLDCVKAMVGTSKASRSPLLTWISTLAVMPTGNVQVLRAGQADTGTL